MPSGKRHNIFESVNLFFREALQLKKTVEFYRFLEFIAKFPAHAPFNNALIFFQNPACGYYATAKEWEELNRAINPGSRPMLIMWPFGPVEFVFDIEDTNGQELDMDKLYWWNTRGKFDEDVFDQTYKNCERLGVPLEKKNPRQYFNRAGFRTAGQAVLKLDGSQTTVLHPRYNEPSAEAYAILCHEIAHHFLGHLGPIVRKVKGKPKTIFQDRRNTPKNIKEIEAETVAWIVLSHLGLEKNSQQYLAGYITGERDLERLEISLLLKIAGRIKEMGKGKVNWGKS